MDLTFDEPLVLDRYQQNPVTGGLIFIDRLSNVTVGAGMVHEPVSQATAAPSGIQCIRTGIECSGSSPLSALGRARFAGG
ncbi:sulfate adenylyltransferase [Escherichia coli]|uniref:Sulfate adenylyltransferase n=1 Tax=Escherichia coli TaxID=562 RepID=A0A376KQ16_ECOLX|nr:sulfate adenylyltransferase [Escherichia coli]